MSVTINTVPTGVNAAGNFQAWWVSGKTDPNSLVLADLTGANSLVIGCFLTEHFEADAAQDAEEDDRACLLEPLETPGTVKWSISDITYVIDPQNPLSDSNAAYAEMIQDASGLIVIRYGLPRTVAPAAGQIFDVYGVTLGPQRKQPMTRGTKIRAKQKPFLSSGRVQDKALSA